MLDPNFNQNLHTHTTFCDGRNTPEEMVERAIALGHKSIGFSAHSYMPYSNELKVTRESTAAYKAEINRLKVKYADKIKIYLGLELDVFSDDDTSGLDYVIGGVHSIRTNDGGFVDFDGSAASFERVIREECGGDGMEFVRRYYAAMEELADRDGIDIVAHFDLVTKHNERVKFFDENSEEYRALALSAAHKVAGKIPFVEINVGAITRGYRTKPYPAPFLLKDMIWLGMRAVIGQDCHSCEQLGKNFHEGVRAVYEAGTASISVLTDEGFKRISVSGGVALFANEGPPG